MVVRLMAEGDFLFTLFGEHLSVCVRIHGRGCLVFFRNLILATVKGIRMQLMFQKMVSKLMFSRV